MNDMNYQSAARKKMKPRPRDGKAMKSKAVPMYPRSAEREFRRINRAYIRVVGKSLKKHMPTIIKAYEKEVRDDYREDGIFEFLNILHEQVMEIAAEIATALEEFGIGKAIERISRMVQNTSIREWARVIKKTFNIGVLEDFYKSEPYEQTIQQWVSGNLSEISTVPQNLLLQIERAIADGYRNGVPVADIIRQVQDTYDKLVRSIDMAARDKVSSLNAELTKMQQTDSGVKKYVWYSSRDGRVRDCHKQFDGNVYTWDEPPEDWYITKSRGIVYTGRRCHPGEAYGCRCIAVPIFEPDSVNLPLR